MIVGANTGKCLRASNYDGAPVEVTTCTGGSDQEWKFDPEGAISLYNHTKCMDVSVTFANRIRQSFLLTLPRSLAAPMVRTRMALRFRFGTSYTKAQTEGSVTQNTVT